MTDFAHADIVSQNNVFEMNMLAGRGMEGLSAGSLLAMSTVQDTFVMPRTSVLTTLMEANGERYGIDEYEVQDDDVVSAIASDYGISVETLAAANNLTNINAIKPGMILKIPPINGILHTVKKGDTVSSLAKKYAADSEKIISFNDLPLAGDLQVGEELIIPDGKLPKSAKQGPVQNISAKRFASLPKLDGYFMVPTHGRKTQGIHGRNGVDIANIMGTPIYAVASGTVTIAKASGYNGGYGKHVKISHPNGTATLYAHMSQVLVKAGEYVEQGQLIGKMGSTGRSTGSHLHIEVHAAANPFAGSSTF